jgi:hypothetical protein
MGSSGCVLGKAITLVRLGISFGGSVNGSFESGVEGTEMGTPHPLSALSVAGCETFPFPFLLLDFFCGDFAGLGIGVLESLSSVVGELPSIAAFA